MRRQNSVGRRAILKKATIGASFCLSLAGCSSKQSKNSKENGSKEFGGWLSDVSNYSNTVDKTGKKHIAIKVGVEGNSGKYAFGPPAIRVNSETTVEWRWTGEGGNHDVVSKNGDFKSELSSQKGHTFKHEFNKTGTFKYFCQPHKSMGMKGVIVVV